MYNPDYCARPHVVALNKVDLLAPQAEAAAGAGAGGGGGQQAAAGRTPPHLVPLVGAEACARVWVHGVGAGLSRSLTAVPYFHAVPYCAAKLACGSCLASFLLHGPRSTPSGRPLRGRPRSTRRSSTRGPRRGRRWRS